MGKKTMKWLFKNKKAVSPVVATILLIALTVSAAAIVYFVVIPMLQQDEEILFTINTVDNFYDYDHDGSIDALKANIVIANTYGTGPADMGSFTYEIRAGEVVDAWEFSEAGVTIISEGSEGDVLISTMNDDNELTEGGQYTLIMTYGASEVTFNFIAGNPTLGPFVEVNVIDQDTNPVSGAEVDFYLSNGAFLGKPTKTTGSEGKVEIALKIGEYQVRVRYLEDI